MALICVSNTVMPVAGRQEEGTNILHTRNCELNKSCLQYFAIVSSKPKSGDRAVAAQNRTTNILFF